MKTLQIIMIAMLLTNLGFSQESSVSHVGVQNSVPTLFINDQAVAATSLFVYSPPNASGIDYNSAAWLDAFKEQVDKVASTGLTYLVIRWYFFSPMFDTSVEPASYGGEIDFTKMDDLFDYAEQQGVYLMPSFWASKPPEWWRNGHINELEQGDEGPLNLAHESRTSFNNPDYWEVMDEYIKVSVERYRSHPALLGWDIRVGATQENNYGPPYTAYMGTGAQPPKTWADYSPYAKNRFREWLIEKYGTDAALQSAWNDPAITLDTAEPPIPEETETSPELAANSPGDIRPEMINWLRFRLDEKGKEWEHFIDLVDSLDPNHIIAMNPAAAFLTPIPHVTKNGQADGREWTRYSKVYMVIIHPRISYYEDGSPWNSENWKLFTHIAYARRLGKIATFAMEDVGDEEGVDISEDRLRSLVPMLAAAGGGMGWVTSPSRQLEWEDEELDIIKEYINLFEPENRSVNIPQIAILVDPRSEQAEYSLSIDNSRSVSRMKFYAALYEAGIEIDPIETAEVIDDPQILDNYKGIVVANLAWLGTSAAQTLYNYAQSGGGLFIAGRTGIFDSAGNDDYTALKELLDLNSTPTDDTISYATWSFDSSSDPLLSGLSGQQVDTGNLYYIPTTDWTNEGYTELGHATAGTQSATVLAKDKTIVWFPRLNIDNDNLIITFFQNWMALFSTISVEEETGLSLPEDFKLEQNYPNPFNPSTTIVYQLPQDGYVALRIFDVLGQEVKTLVDGNQSAGNYSAIWDGKDSFGKEAVGGIYFLQLRAKDLVQTKKLLLLK